MAGQNPSSIPPGLRLRPPYSSAAGILAGQLDHRVALRFHVHNAHRPVGLSALACCRRRLGDDRAGTRGRLAVVRSSAKGLVEPRRGGGRGTVLLFFQDPDGLLRRLTCSCARVLLSVFRGGSRNNGAQFRGTAEPGFSGRPGLRRETSKPKDAPTRKSQGIKIERLTCLTSWYLPSPRHRKATSLLANH